MVGKGNENKGTNVKSIIENCQESIQPLVVGLLSSYLYFCYKICVICEVIIGNEISLL